jgi:DNA-binding NarL/FixJ family response regulator
MPPQEILVCAKPSAARRVAGVLRSRGYAVETAGDGARAVERAERDNPAVVLIWSDLRGPETSAVVRRVREASGAKVAVIVKSNAIDRASTFLEAGADTVLPDVRDLDRLARTVDRLLEGGLVVDPALDLPASDDFVPEEPVLNGKSDHVEDEADQARDPGAEETSPDVTLLPEAEPGIPFEQCDVAEIVLGAAAEAAQGHPSVVVQVAAPPRLPTVAHPAALRGAVRALVEEACRDSEAGSNVTVKAQRVDAGIFVLVAARGAGPDQAEATDGEAPTGFTLARALVALHGGILSAEPIPAGGSRVSFTIPGQPPLLRGVELQGGFRALELLAQAEAARDVELAPSSDPDVEHEDDGQLLEQAIDLAAAAADAAALAPEQPAEPEGHADPVRSLAELFGLEPDPEPPAMEDEPAEVDVEVPPAAGIEAEELPEADPPPAPERQEEAPQAEVEELPELEMEELLEVEVEELPEVEAEVPEEEPAETEPEPEDDLPVITLPPPDEASEPASTGDVELGSPPEPILEPVAIPEPVPAAEGSSAEPAPQQPAAPSKTYVADPLHPATAILRALAEEFDDQSNSFQGF